MSFDLSQLIFEQNQDGFLAFDQELRYLAWNPAMERISGMKAAEVLGKVATEVFPFLQETGEDQLFHAALRGESVSSPVQAYTVPKTGRKGYFEGRYNPLRDASGRIIGGMASIRELTAQIDAERTKSQQRLNAIFGGTPAIITVLRGPDFIFEYINPQAEIVLGTREVLGERVLDVLPQLRGTFLDRAAREVIETGKPFLAKEVLFPYLRPGADVAQDAWFDLMYSPLLDSKGQTDGFFCFASEVTDRVLVRETAIVSETRFRTMFEQSPLALQIRSADGVCIEANDAWGKIWGLPKEAAIGHNVFEDQVAIDSGLIEQIRKAFAGEEVQLPDVYYDPAKAGKDGRPRWVRPRAFPLKHASGRKIGKVREIVTILEDVTDEKAKEENLRAREKYFRDIAEAVPIIMWTSDASAKVDYFNPQVYAYTGLPPESNPQELWLDIIHPDDIPKLHAHITDLPRTGAELKMEFRIRRADGSYRWHSARTVKVKSDEGVVIKRVGIATDIDDRKRVADMLWSILTHAPAAISIVSVPELRVELANEPMREFFGDRPLQGHTVHEVVPADVLKSYIPWVDEVIRTGRTYLGHEYRSDFLVRPDGSPRYFDFVLQPLRDEQGKTISIVHFVIEITDSVVSRRNTEEMFRQASEALRARDEFLSICSHELNSPITSLKFLTQTAVRQIQRGEFHLFTPERLTRMIENQNRQIAQIANLIGDMLDVSRVVTGRLLLKPTDTDLSRLIRDVCGRFASELASAGCELRLELAPTLEVRCDSFRIEQILTNLLTNAIRYAPGAPVELSASAAGPVAEIILQDHGPGIPLEDQKRIFERFERATSSDAPGGLGLGLYIARNIAQLHGGNLSVESEPGRGSAFVLSLPIAGPPA